MKWIGENIHSYVSRFRSDVYLESPTAGGSDPDKFLGIDSDGKIIYRTGAEVFSDIGATVGDITSVTAGTGLSGGGTDGDVTLNVNTSLSHVTTLAGLTFIGTDGETLNIHSDNLSMVNGSTQAPNVTFTCTRNDATGSSINLTKQRTSGPSVLAGVDSDVLGNIKFWGYNDGTPSIKRYATITGISTDATTGEEAGGLYLGVKAHGYANPTTGLKLDGDTNVSQQVDVTIGAGTTSTTTIAGDLDIGGDEITSNGALTLDIDGLLKTTALGMEIENASDSGTSALLIDNDDVDKHALEIEAANTTVPAVKISSHATTGVTSVMEIDCNALGSGGRMMTLDFDDSETVSYSSRMINLEYNKTGVIADGEDSDLTGLYMGLYDTATNHSNGVMGMTGIDMTIDSASTAGGSSNLGMNIRVSDGSDNTGIVLNVEDGVNNNDINFSSSTNPSDHAYWQTGVNGATIIGTSDADAALAHFEIAPDGDIILDANGQIKLEPVAGNNILLDGTIAIDAGVVTGATSITSTAFVGTLTGGATVGKGARHFGSTLKILPQDFMSNDDSPGNNLNYKEAGNAGIQVDNASLEAIAFVAIPEGMKATHVDIYGSQDSGVEVIEEDITDTVAWTGGAAATDLAGGSGEMNTQITLSSAVESTADNMLAIKVTLTATNHRIYGGKVTIATI